MDQHTDEVESYVENKEQISTKNFITTDEAVERVGFGTVHILLIIFAGLNWFMAGFLILILSILSDILKCEWGLTVEEEALLTSLFFLGILCGAQFWGFMGDKYGRKKAIILTNGLTAVFGILTSFSPYFFWMLILRIFTGFALSGSGVVIVTYLSEFMPRRYRGTSVLSMEVFFAVGGIIVVAIGMFMVPSVGWRWYLLVSSIPAVSVTAMSFLIPQSPRYLVLRGRPGEALKIINRIAKFNCRQIIQEQLVIKRQDKKVIPSFTKVNFVKHQSSQLTPSEESEKVMLLPGGKNVPHGNDLHKKSLQILPLFQNGMWKTTFLLVLIWPCTMSFIYGSVLLSTSLFERENHCGNSQNPLSLDICQELELEDYTGVMWTLASEIPGLLIAAILLLCLGRKVVMGIEMFLCAVFVGLLYICLSRTVLTGFIFCSRALLTGVYQILYVYTPEVYPTNVRALSLGVCTAAGNLGAAISPYIAQVIIEANDIAGISVFLGLLSVSMLAVILLPIETRGKTLKDAVTTNHPLSIAPDQKDVSSL